MSYIYIDWMLVFNVVLAWIQPWRGRGHSHGGQCGSWCSIFVLFFDKGWFCKVISLISTTLLWQRYSEHCWTLKNDLLKRCVDGVSYLRWLFIYIQNNRFLTIVLLVLIRFTDFDYPVWYLQALTKQAVPGCVYGRMLYFHKEREDEEKGP